MRKSTFIIFIFLVFMACSMADPINPICPHDDSWICEKSEEIGIYPETFYGWIYSAAAIAAVTDVMEIKEICDFEKTISEFYQDSWPISYISLIDEVLRITNFMPPEKSILVKNIINVNLIQYQSTELISPADDAILRKGHVAFRRDMACFD